MSTALNLRTLGNLNLLNKRVLIRADLDVPVQDGVVTDPKRLARFATTLQRLQQSGAITIIIGHLGRPKSRDMEYSLLPVAKKLAAMTGLNIPLLPDCVGEEVKAAVMAMRSGDVVMLENLRFYPAETAGHASFDRYRQEAGDATDFANQLAQLGEVYINDAFANSHRPHTSMVALAKLLPSYAGPNICAEVDALQKILEVPRPPVMAIVGGSKISTKLDVLNHIVPRMNMLVLGGAMANTFIAARGGSVGSSMYEKDMLENARVIMTKAETTGCEIILPVDAQLADAVKGDANIRTAPIADIQPHEMILDYGPDSIAILRQKIDACHTLLWNGPLGVFEIPPFDIGTVAVAEYAAQRVQADKLTAIAGGGDTAAAMSHAGVANDLTYVSTAGGAFLEWLEGKTLPGVAALAA
jgi:phosphoglycerate kinase